MGGPGTSNLVHSRLGRSVSYAFGPPILGSWALLGRFLGANYVIITFLIDLVRIFIDFGRILEGFWKDFGSVLKSFFDDFHIFFKKLNFAKTLKKPRFLQCFVKVDLCKGNKKSMKNQRKINANFKWKKKAHKLT